MTSMICILNPRLDNIKGKIKQELTTHRKETKKEKKGVHGLSAFDFNGASIFENEDNLFAIHRGCAPQDQSLSHWVEDKLRVLQGPKQQS